MQEKGVLVKLYVYDHCPFCVRSRIILGLKNIEYEVVYLLNNDEETPVRLIGKKMLPVLLPDTGQAIGESLEIVRYIDINYGSQILTESNIELIDTWMETVTSSIYKLAVPRWAYSEFEEFKNEDARRYFIDKKELIFGNFEALMNQSDPIITELNEKLVALDLLINPDLIDNDKFSFTDICLFPLLRSLSIVKGIIWPSKVGLWLHKMSIKSSVNLNHDIAL